MLDKNDPMNMFRNPKKYQGIMTEKEAKEKDKRKHEEADLHLLFCKWVKLQYPNDHFVRHECEKARSFFMQNLFHVYNSGLDKLPDFELLEPATDSFGYFVSHRLYIEFKKPGTTLTLKDGITIKPEYSGQYKRHVRFWEQNSPAYFCSNFDEAIKLFIAYKNGKPLPMQIFNF